MITGISEFGFFCPKMAVSWRATVFQKMFCWNPDFYCVFWGRVFWAEFSKEGIFDTHQKKKLTDNWKVHFLIFLCFFCFLSLLFVFCWFFVLFFCFLFFVFFLGPKPFFCFGLFYLFIFCLFLSVPLCFSLAFFGLPPFQFLFLCLSLSLSCFFFFLLVFLVCFLLVPCFSLFHYFSVFFAFVSWKEQHQKIQLQSFCFFNQSCVFLFPVMFSLWNPFVLPLFCCFLIFHLCFLFNINVVGFKQQVEKHQCLVKRGVATKRSFYNLCFVKSEKFFGARFWAKFWLMFKKHYENRYFNTFSKPKKRKNMTILKGYYLGQVRVIFWAKFVAT